MYRFRFAALAAVAAYGFASVASAADLPVKAPVYKAPATFSWTGCFIGGNAGGIWARDNWTLAPGDPVAAAGGPFVVGSEFASHDANSWLGGVQAGCDYQFSGGFVIGIQGDYDWTDAKATSADAANDSFFGNPGFTNQTRIKSLGSVTGRLGYAWDRILGYVRGGWASQRNEYTSFDSTGITWATASETRSGWTIGVGGEYAFTNWLSAFAEYDYYDFGTRTNTLIAVVQVPQRTSAGGIYDIANIRAYNNVFKVGLNVRFGPGAR